MEDLLAIILVHLILKGRAQLKNLGILIMGGLIGLWFASNNFRTNSNSVTPLAENETTEAVSNKVLATSAVPAEVLRAKPQVKSALTHEKLMPSPPTKTMGLIINEENVAEMERLREYLRDYAFATQTQEGWKIQILPEDKVFLKAGLASGDLITFEGIKQQMTIPDRAQLVARMVAILGVIER